MPKFMLPRAVAFGSESGDATYVDGAHPLPVQDPNSAAMASSLSNMEGLMGVPLDSMPHEKLDDLLDLEIVPFNFSTATSHTIKLGGGGQTIRVHGLIFTNAADTNITFEDVILTGATTGDLTMLLRGAGGGLPRQGRPWFTLPADANLVITNSAAVQVTGWAYIKKA
ncbi:hypothetical protein OOT33_13710 [Sphingobium sp. DEHP117]|uniref:hypothetical protein n=1 Tax=Sphingobium sp. DEHP117 TaxID=2993436 RepID=UPI0027D56928|nr:hypothetical protein [Sphingobium sp. DEHP117]MDQ4421479.1 hypothetical protein [Sphingobium sp. DEHP117]